MTASCETVNGFWLPVHHLLSAAQHQRGAEASAISAVGNVGAAQVVILFRDKAMFARVPLGCKLWVFDWLFADRTARRCVEHSCRLLVELVLRRDAGQVFQDAVIFLRCHSFCPQIRRAGREACPSLLLDASSLVAGAVVGSAVTRFLVYAPSALHTCKSRSCPSCGHRATELWQREPSADLPDIPYMGLVFTMPDVLWPILRKNRHLLYDLPRLGASVIQQWVKAQYRVRVMILVVQHTFGRL